MWSELSLPWQAALEESWVAFCAGSVPIGAVITDAAGAILARGRSHRYDDQELSPGQIGLHPLGHAELNALLVLPKTVDPHSCTLYTVFEPCPLCLGAIYMAGIRRFCYASRDPYAGSANLLGASWYLSYKPVQAEGPFNEKLENLLLGWQVTFFAGRDGDRFFSSPVYARWEESIPRGAAFGRRLHQSGLIERFHTERWKIARVVNELARQV